MNSFRIVIKNSNIVKKILGLADDDFLTVLVYEGMVFMSARKGALYVHCSFEIVESDLQDSMLSFRLDRLKFLSMITDSNLEFIITQKDTILTFTDKNNELIYNMVTMCQLQSAEDLVYNVKNIEKAVTYPVVDLKSSLSMINLARKTDSTFSVYDGVEFIRQPGYSIFRPSEVTNLTSFGKELYLLTQLEGTLHNVDNCLVKHGDFYDVILTKPNAIISNEYGYINSLKPHAIIEFNMDNMVRLSKRMKLNEGSFVIDFSDKICKFEEYDKNGKVKIDQCKYSTSIKFRKVQVRPSQFSKGKLTEQVPMPGSGAIKMPNGEVKMPGQVAPSLPEAVTPKPKLPRIKVPAGVLRTVIPSLYVGDYVKAVIKKEFVELHFGDKVVVFGRTEV